MVSLVFLGLPALVAAWCSPAGAHEALRSVVWGGSVAVKALVSDGEPLAHAPCEVFSPADPKIPWQTGRTDREGWVAFVPNVAGEWRVRVTGDDGHGLDTLVEVAEEHVLPDGGGDHLGTTAFVLRPLVGALLVALIFGALILAWRKRKSRAAG
jgi:nickel transport protein